MTFNALMDALKLVFNRAAYGPLRDKAWQVVRDRAGRDLQRMVQRDSNLAALDYSFNMVVDYRRRGPGLVVRPPAVDIGIAHGECTLARRDCALTISVANRFTTSSRQESP